MNKHEKEASRERRPFRSSMTIWSAVAALVVTVLLILGLNSSEPSTFYRRGAIAAAILLLVLRLIVRRVKGNARRAAQPDPQSTLKLD